MREKFTSFRCFVSSVSGIVEGNHNPPVREKTRELKAKPVYSVFTTPSHKSYVVESTAGKRRCVAEFNGIDSHLRAAEFVGSTRR